MKIRCHYAISFNVRLMQFLKKNCVSYKMCPIPGESRPLCIFDLYEDQDSLRKFKTQFPFYKEIGKYPEYSKREIENAEWLSIRSKLKCVEWEYRPSAFLLSCEYSRLYLHDKKYKHAEQVNLLTVTKPIKWGTKMYFSGPNAADDILFCSDQARRLLDGRWNGLSFLHVMNSNGEYYNDLYQLSFKNRLPVNALSGGKKTICSTCGRSILRLKGGPYQLEIQKQCFDNGNSVYTTGSVLADWLTGFPTYAISIVPHSFYQYCEDKGMNHGMIYEPITLM